MTGYAELSGPSGSYQDIFAGQDIPEKFRGPDHYFFHTVTEAESEVHAGETYAIPRQVRVTPEEGPSELYDHYENGTIVNVRTNVEPEVKFMGRSVVDARVLQGETRIGWASVVGWQATLIDTYVGDQVEIGPRAIVDNAHLSGGSKLGEDVDIRAGEDETLVGSNATLEDHVRLMGDNHVGAHSTLHWASRMDQGAVAGAEAELDERSIVGKNAELGDKSRLMANVRVKPGKRIKNNTIVFPEHFRHSKRGW